MSKQNRVITRALMCALLLLFFFLLLPFSLAQAGLDPQVDKPYHLQVVLRFARNRLLNRLFQDLVERQLQDSLQAAFGDLAEVEIVHDHPLLKQVDERGLQAALDGDSSLSETKIHFVLIDFVNGRYEIQARQHDGFTGLASPVVRRSSTADRQLVARSAALLINVDFGLAGTLEVDRTRAENANINIKLKGGGLGVSLLPWLQKGQVFAVAQIGGQRSFGMPFTLLQVQEQPQGPVCRCRLLHRLKNPLSQAPGILGYRCLKLGTTREPLHLRVVRDDRLKSPLTAVQVWIHDRSFEGEVLDRTSTKADGLVTSEHSYDNVAFVDLFYERQQLARIPTEIVDGLTITCPVHVGDVGGAIAQFYDRRDLWMRRLSDSRDVAETIIRQLNAMRGEASENVLARAEKGLQALQTDINELPAEQTSLRAIKARDLPKATGLDLSKGEELLHELEARRDELQRYIGDLQRIITDEKDPRRQRSQEMVAQARHLEREAEFDAAIKLYERVLEQVPDSPQVRDKLMELKREWTPKNEAHARAQKFIYETWPSLQTAAQIQARLDEARKAFQICKENGDSLSPRKLLKTYEEHAARLVKEVDALRPAEREDDRRTAETIEKLTPELEKFNEQVKQYLSKPKQGP
jgi:tetratricopeptide (TPR) repeat protein